MATQLSWGFLRVCLAGGELVALLGCYPLMSILYLLVVGG